MARLPYLDKSDLAEADHDLLARDINLHKILVHSPAACRAFGKLGGFIRHESTLDTRLRELAILQVGWLARSPYEWSHHVKIGQTFGVTKDDIRALITESEGGDGGLSEADAAVLKAAREMTTDLKVSYATYAVLEKHFSKEHLVDLTLTIAFYNAVVRFLATTEMDVEDSYMPYLMEFPLPD